MVTGKYRRAAVLLLIFASAAILSASGQPTAPAAQDCPEMPVSLSGDLNSNKTIETYCLEDHKLTVEENGQILWNSPDEYNIDSIALGDIDNDGKGNLVITLWKEGCFRTSRPFWHTGADISYKNHLFVYQLKDQTFRQVWGSSDLDHPILSFEIRDVNDDGKKELVTVEGEYEKIAGERYAANPDGKKATTVWQWSGWGFERL